ncbi:FlaD/FlaE family flagellar protein [Haladaptatus sp. CMSO5]|uniref:FlaD/FlaE family flagellar protein n=1 Tax=Haladaptatus sp. CMSO5 TaxID=3120514 RepID=UPI002FCE520A
MAIQDFIDSIFGGREQEDGEPVSEETGPVEPEEPVFEEDQLTVTDLEHRIDELEGDIERTNSSIRGIESAQNDVRDEVAEMNDTVRRLLGVYDQLTADVNPFTDSDGAGFKFGVIDQPAAADENPEPSPDPTAQPADNDVVSFSDLEAAYADESAADEEPADDLVVDPVEEAAPEPDPAENLSSIHPAERNAAKTKSNGTAARGHANQNDKQTQTVCLTSIAESYAADLLIFEWLSELVNAAGPAGALKALSYYEAVDWISPEVGDYLETVLGGPDLDVHIDPNRPGDLTASDHADSYTYILKLNALSEMDGPLHTEE